MVRGYKVRTDGGGTPGGRTTRTDTCSVADYRGTFEIPEAERRRRISGSQRMEGQAAAAAATCVRREKNVLKWGGKIVRTHMSAELAYVWPVYRV